MPTNATSLGQPGGGLGWSHYISIHCPGLHLYMCRMQVGLINDTNDALLLCNL